MIVSPSGAQNAAVFQPDNDPASDLALPVHLTDRHADERQVQRDIEDGTARLIPRHSKKHEQLFQPTSFLTVFLTVSTLQSAKIRNKIKVISGSLIIDFVSSTTS